MYVCINVCKYVCINVCMYVCVLEYSILSEPKVRTFILAFVERPLYLSFTRVQWSSTEKVSALPSRLALLLPLEDGDDDGLLRAKSTLISENSLETLVALVEKIP